MNILNALPGIVPTARTFTMGRWPQKRMKMRNARTVRWGLCNKPSGDKIDLTWENITYAQAELLSIVWDNNYGLYGTLALPPVPNVPPMAGLTPEILGGTSGALENLLEFPFPGATWHLAGPPQVQAVKAGRCNVTMSISVRAAVSEPLSTTRTPVYTLKIVRLAGTWPFGSLEFQDNVQTGIISYGNFYQTQTSVDGFGNKNYTMYVTGSNGFPTGIFTHSQGALVFPDPIYAFVIVSTAFP